MKPLNETDRHCDKRGLKSNARKKEEGWDVIGQATEIVKERNCSGLKLEIKGRLNREKCKL
jgi:hypothetical protein